MRKMLVLVAFQLLLYVVYVRADYGCLCIRGGSLDVYYQPFVLSQKLGQLKDGDCKPTYQAGTSVNWTGIQFHNQVGFIVNASIINFYNCQGSPIDKDAFSTVDSTLPAASNKQHSASHVLMKLTTIASLSTETTTKTTTTTTATTKTIISISTKRISKPTTSTQLPQTTNALTTKRLLRCPPQVRAHGARDHLEVNGRCYEFIMTPHKNWPDAEHDCNTRGGHLVTLGSMAEQNLIYNALMKKHFYHGDNYVWIGLTDKDVDEHWRWVSGERTRFTYWDSGESHGNFEDCAMLEMDRGGHWGDVSCTGFLFSTEKHGYICEYNLV